MKKESEDQTINKLLFEMDQTGGCSVPCEGCFYNDTLSCPFNSWEKTTEIMKRKLKELLHEEIEKL